MRATWIVFCKELRDVLRDHRTLMAMLLVPLLLYPALLLIGMQALKFEQGHRERETYTVLAETPQAAEVLRGMLDLGQEEEAKLLQEPTGTPLAAPASPFRAHLVGSQFSVAILNPVSEEPGAEGTASAPAEEQDMRARMTDAVRSGQAPLAVVIRQEWHALPVPPGPGQAMPGRWDVPTFHVTVLFDATDPRSRVALEGLRRILDQASDARRRARLEAVQIDPQALEAVVATGEQVATVQRRGAAILGNPLLPFLLVIMTVTGAIYPAIDLTVGERERGTLETLLITPASPGSVMAGKFLVVLLISMATAGLNLGSMAATISLTGLGALLAGPGAAPADVRLPIESLPLVLLSMLPFAVLFSALMLATCSFARSFKEAQNYMMPVIMVVMVPALAASTMPSLKLDGWVAIIPVANSVVMIRDLFLGEASLRGSLLAVGSTTLYAAAAVSGAARLYGHEATLFGDAVSYQAFVSRKLIQPALRPTASLALLTVALLFPVFFYVQASGMPQPELFATDPDDAKSQFLRTHAITMLGLFVVVPLLVAWHFKLDPRTTFALRLGTPRAWLAAGLLSAGTAVLATKVINDLVRSGQLDQQPAALKAMEEMFLAMPVWQGLLVLALLPAVCEELCFRGLLTSGLATRLRTGALCVVGGLMFGLFHIEPVRVVATGLLGMALTLLVLRGGSVFPAMLAHAAHNAFSYLLSLDPEFVKDLSPVVIVPALLCVGAGVAVLIPAGVRAGQRPGG